MMLLLLLISSSSTLLECRSNQGIRPKTDSRVPRCGFLLNPCNWVQGWAQWLRWISGSSLLLLTPASARSTASCGHSWKTWEIVSWPFSHHLQAGSTSGRKRFSYERRARWCPHRRRARCTRSCRCRSASSGLTGGRASPRRVLGGALAKALATKFWCNQEPD